MNEPTLAPSFVVLYPALCEVAQNLGYALAVHGSLRRDMDLIAAPWTDEARPAQELVWRIKEACGGYIVGGRDGRDPMQKPHGRLAWSIHLDAGNYIDLSVMPRIKVTRQEQAESDQWEKALDDLQRQFDEQAMRIEQGARRTTGRIV